MLDSPIFIPNDTLYLHILEIFRYIVRLLSSENVRRLGMQSFALHQGNDEGKIVSHYREHVEGQLESNIQNEIARISRTLNQYVEDKGSTNASSLSPLPRAHCMKSHRNLRLLTSEYPL